MDEGHTQHQQIKSRWDLGKKNFDCRSEFEKKMNEGKGLECQCLQVVIYEGKFGPFSLQGSPQKTTPRLDCRRWR